MLIVGDSTSVGLHDELKLVLQDYHLNTNSSSDRSGGAALKIIQIHEIDPVPLSAQALDALQSLAVPQLAHISLFAAHLCFSVFDVYEALAGRSDTVPSPCCCGTRVHMRQSQTARPVPTATSLSTCGQSDTTVSMCQNSSRSSRGLLPGLGRCCHKPPTAKIAACAQRSK